MAVTAEPSARTRDSLKGPPIYRHNARLPDSWKLLLSVFLVLAIVLVVVLERRGDSVENEDEDRFAEDEYDWPVPRPADTFVLTPAPARGCKARFPGVN